MADQQNKTKNKQHKEGHVTFDEATIAEHDKLRGTRQKIDEPKTPYHRPSIDETEDNEWTEPEDAKSPNNNNAGELKWGDLEARLQQAADSNELPKAAEKAKHDAFESKRKSHYNEFQMMKQWKQEHQDEEDDE